MKTGKIGNKRFELTRPLLVYAIALAFVAAPFFNVVASMIAYSVPHWYYPSTFLGYVEHLSAHDAGWLLMVFVAGCALLHQRKWSWMLALSAIGIAMLFNIYNSLSLGHEGAYGRLFLPIVFGTLNGAVVAILYFFRYPYLDRRDAFWGVYPRYACSFSVKGNGFSAHCTNISRSGVFLVDCSAPFEMDQEIVFAIAGTSPLNARVVRVSKAGYGIQFETDARGRTEIKKLIADSHLSICIDQKAA